MWRRTIGLIVGIVLCWVPNSGATDLRFPEIAGWKQSADIQTFDPKTLYEYIRGGFRQTPSVKNPAAALKWVLQDPNVHTIVPGFTTFDQMDVDLAVMEDVGLSDSEKKDLLQEASLPGLYCQGCRECLGQCVARLPIPDLMRAYMYVYDYRNLGMAQDLVVSLALPSRVCEDCSLCPVNCAVGFSVREKIRDIARLREIPSEFIA
ncbi:MAG: hypothetical protein KKF02_13580 [Proteobacteria bacterium]|nr:hypothetical protein [Pseudomonadota bacterium]